MSIQKATVLAVLVAAIPVAAHAQLNVQWVGFQNQTSTRLFPAPPDSVGANDPQEKDYAWADVDHDGDIDLVLVRKVPLSEPGGKRGVLYMNEDGVLVDRTAQYASLAVHVPAAEGVSQGLLDEANNRDVIFVDVDNDGWLDFVTAVTISDVPVMLPKYLSHPRIYRNLGESGGVWQGFEFDYNRSPQLFILDAGGNPTIPYPGRFCAVAGGDVDGDGDVDLYLADYDTGEVGPAEPAGRDTDDRLWLNDGTGHFIDSNRTLMSAAMLQSAFAMAAEIVNINGVGRNEVIKDSALGSPQSVKISYNTDGDTPLEVSDEPYSASPYYVSTGDLNNDGKLDMVVTDDSDDRYLLNTGNGAPPLNLAQFGANLLFQFADGSGDEGFGSQSLIVDLNNDGWKDVLIANVDVDTGPNCSDRLRIYHNLGNAPNVTLKEEAQTNTSSGWKGAVGLINSDLAGTYHTAVFDLDGDGDQDLMIGRCAGNFVWINQLNPCPSVTYGTVNNNSTGQPARISIYGSGSLQGTLPPEAPEPHLIFNVRNLPPNAVGHLVYSPQAKTPCVAYGDGQLCILRRARQLHELPAVQADASGRARVVLDFAAEPFASAVAGQHWYFQFVYADSGPAGFNLSEAVNVQVCQ